MAEVLVMVHSWEYVVLTGTVTPPHPSYIRTSGLCAFAAALPSLSGARRKRKCA